ncbi:hypothetical protein STEG23_021158, partial [Scotinomys teguina]
MNEKVDIRVHASIINDLIDLLSAQRSPLDEWKVEPERKLLCCEDLGGAWPRTRLK